MVDLDLSTTGREVHHTALEISRRRLKLRMPEALLTRIFSALRFSPGNRAKRAFGFHPGSLSEEAVSR